MRKKLIIFIIILLAILAYIVTVILQANKSSLNIKTVIESNMEAYEYVVKFYYNDFSNSTVSYLAYSFIEDDTVYCYDEKFHAREILLNKKEIDIFKVVKESYNIDERPIDRVYVYEKYVALCNEKGRAAIVYSVDGSIPRQIDCLSEEIDNIKVNKIFENWYYVVGK